MAGKSLTILILLSAVSLVTTLPQPAQFVAALLQVFLLPGLAFSFFFLGKRTSRSDQWVLSVLLSPVLVAMLTAPVSAITGDIYTAAKIVILVGYLAFAAALVTGKHRHTSGQPAQVPPVIYVISIAYAGLILVSYLVNDFLMIRADAWYHAAVTRQVMVGGIPPKDPFLADFSIKYMWFYHLFQAVWIKRSGLSLFHALASFNILNALIFPYLAMRFASYFTKKKSVMVLAALFAIAGLDSASWVFWPVGFLRAFVGDVTGMAEIKRILANITFDGAAVIKFLTPEGTWQVNWNDKFLTITIFSYSLNMFLACIILILKDNFLTQSRIKSIVVLFVMILGTVLFHIVTGIVLIYGLVGSSILLYVGRRYIFGEQHSLSEYTVPIVTVILVSLFALPYLYSLVSTGNPAGGNSLLNSLFHFGVTSLLTITFPLAILFVPARRALRDLLSRRDRVSRTMLAWILLLFVLCVFINLGVVGEKKLIYFLFLIIGPPIYIQIVEQIRGYAGARRMLAVAVVLVLFVIPPVLTFRGFMLEKPQDAMWSRRYTVTNEDMRLFTWLKENTHPEAVVVEEDNFHLSPVYGGRRNLYSEYNTVAAMGYGGPKLDVYRRIQGSIFGRDPLTRNLIDDMKKVEHPLFIAVWRDDIESSPWLEGRFKSHPEWFKEVYDSDRVSLYTTVDEIP